jgi:hypothetical protein
MGIDVLFTSVPLTLSKTAPAAPAILIAMLEKYGYTGHFYDFNIEVNDDPKVNDFAIKNSIDDFDYIDNILKTHATRMLEVNPTYIGISIFTYQCLNFARALCVYIRTMAPQVKIILGGQGLGVGGISGDSIGSELEKLNLCDYWVRSEGEYPIIDILKGTYKNTDEWVQAEDLDEFPYPNYDSYDWSKYRKLIPITGSRGCVRRCTFCDIHTHWKKFVWRDGIKIAEEMSYQSKKYNIRNFDFTDSLVNGSMKSYISFVNSLSEFNSTRKEKILWSGQFIFRPQRQMSEDVWKLTAESGCNNLYVGIESLSESVRNHMRKKFSNDDIRYSLKLMKKYGINCTFLMIIGYITDTNETIQETLDAFTEFSPYANNTIKNVSMGTTLGILPGTPLEEMANEEGVTLGNIENAWSGPSTLEQRIEWHSKVANHCKSLGYKVKNEDEQSNLISVTGL